jgi:hypothetical protein
MIDKRPRIIDVERKPQRAKWGQAPLRPELTGLCWLHCNFDDVSGVPVEVHFHPSVEKDGQFLLREIMLAGNFGQSDPRMETVDTSSLMKRRLSQAWRRFKRNLRFLTSYPREVIWEPFARMYHFGWKLWLKL